MEELERTYLAKYIPEGLEKCAAKRIVDRYIPLESQHPVLRLRKSGEKMELTKKQPAKEGDASCQIEETIPLNKEEYAALFRLPAKAVVKTRYIYPCGEVVAEVDVFEEDLSGLVLVDVEFENVTAKENFKMPEFCLAEVTQDKSTAGGMLAGKKYADIQAYLNRAGYKKIIA